MDDVLVCCSFGQVQALGFDGEGGSFFVLYLYSPLIAIFTCFLNFGHYGHLLMVLYGTLLGN